MDPNILLKAVVLIIKVIIIVLSSCLQIGLTCIYLINKILKRGGEIPWGLYTPIPPGKDRGVEPSWAEELWGEARRKPRPWHRREVLCGSGVLTLPHPPNHTPELLRPLPRSDIMRPSWSPACFVICHPLCVGL